MTESARKASVRNGVAPVQPSVVGGLVAGAALLDDLGQRCVGEEPGDGSGHSATTLEPVDGDDAASELREALDRERQLAVGHADDDEVVRVVRDARRERAALQPRARDEAEPTRPVARCRSTTAIFARSCSALATACPPSTTGSRSSDSVTT